MKAEASKSAVTARRAIPAEAWWSLGATALLLSTTVGTAILLMPRTLAMGFGGAGRPVGPGTVPLVVLVLMIALSLWIAVSEVRKLRARMAEGDAAGADDADTEAETAGDAGPRATVLHALGVFGALCLFIPVWRMTNFPVAGSVLTVALSLALRPPPWRGLRGSALSVAVALLITLGVWVLFEFILNIRLH